MQRPKMAMILGGAVLICCGLVWSGMKAGRTPKSENLVEGQLGATQNNKLTHNDLDAAPGSDEFPDVVDETLMSESGHFSDAEFDEPLSDALKKEVEEMEAALKASKGTNMDAISNLVAVWSSGSLRDEIYRFIDDAHHSYDTPQTAFGLAQLKSQRKELGEALSLLQRQGVRELAPKLVAQLLVTNHIRSGNADEAFAETQTLNELYKADLRRRQSAQTSSADYGELISGCLLEAVVRCKKHDERAARRSLDECGKDLIPETVRLEAVKDIASGFDCQIASHEDWVEFSD